jgi:hypothetical protein
LLSTASAAVGALAALLVGASISYSNVTLVSWMQSQTPGALMGRMMSLVALK